MIKIIIEEKEDDIDFTSIVYDETSEIELEILTDIIDKLQEDREINSFKTTNIIK